MSIVIVGAGSLDFNGPILRSLLPVAAQRGLDLCLCDRDPGALDDMARIADRLAAELDARVPARATVDVADAATDASFVILTLNHGGLAADRADFLNAVEHGYSPKHIDTIGPAGWLRALRMGAFAQRLLSALPVDATLLSLSNPLPLILRIAERRGFRAIGFCHGAENRRASFRSWLGLDAAPELVVWGTNHLAWMTELRLGDRDLYPALVDFLGSSPAHRGWRLNLELYERHGVMPVLEAQHMADFFAGLESEEDLAAYGLRLWEHEPRVKAAEGRRRRRAALASGEMPVSQVRASAEGVAEVVDALLGGPPFRGILNAPLEDHTNGLPQGAIIEGWVTVNAQGTHPDAAPALPVELCDQLRRVHRQQDLAAHAAESGNLEKLVEAWAMEPNMRGTDKVRSMLRRGLAEHQGLLPKAWQAWA